MKIEKRTVAVNELRVSGNKQPKIVGKIPYNSPSDDIGFIEVLKPGCFSDSLRFGKKIFSLWNHQSGKPLANTNSGTLKLRDAETGLDVEIIPDVKISWAKDAVESVRRGDTAGLSFGFVVNPGGERLENGTREIISADLLEISPVVFPAYSESKVTARNKRGKRTMETLKILQARYRELKGKLKKLPETSIEERTEIQEQLEITERAIDAIHPEDKNEHRANIEVGDDNRTKKPFKSFGEQIRAVINAGSPGGQIDPRLHEVRAVSGLGESISSEGGFLLQSDHSDELLETTIKSSPILRRLNRFTLGEGKNGLKLPKADEDSRATGSRWGGIRLYHRAEAGQYTASHPKFEMLNLSLNSLVGLCYVTDELMEDLPSLENWVHQAFQDEFRFTLEDVVVSGSGAGQGRGLMNSTALVEVSKESGQVADTIYTENVLKMFQRLHLRGSDAGVCWLANRDTFFQIMTMTYDIGTGGELAKLYVPARKPGETGSLLGYPVEFIEQAETLGDKGDICLVDLGSIVLIEKAGGMQMANSIHFRFDYGEQTLRFTYRYDLQPIYSSAITQYKGADSLSPYVCLAERA